MNKLDVDKSEWGDGPWLHEPDFKRWIDPGAWCGYVGVPHGHPAFGMDYYYSDYLEDVILTPIQRAINDVSVHGGITYADRGGEYPVEDDPYGSVIYYFGFDCSHAGDYSPAMEALYAKIMDKEMPVPRHGEVYRELPYVMEQCTVLAAQLKKMEGLSDVVQ